MKIETLKFKRLVRMAAVGAEIRHRLPKLAGKLLDAITGGVGSLKDLTAALASARGRVKELARLKKFVRASLRSDLEAIKRTAHAVAINQPEFDDKKFRLPSNGDQRLLTAARSAAQDAAPVAAAFVAHAMSPNFVDALKTRIQAFERTLSDYAAAKRSVDDLKEQIRRTMQGTLGGSKRLDAAVRNTLGDDETALAAWDRACELRRRRTKRAAVGEIAETPPQPGEPPVAAPTHEADEAGGMTVSAGL